MKNLSDITIPKLKKMSKVNLDALIPRADFIDEAPHSSKDLFSEITLGSLVRDSYSSNYDLFRKPDFQRETNEWDKTKICDLIYCFMTGNFMPSIILWKSQKGLIYVIDGAHRLSALVAYINNDYGDKEISQKYFDYRIPDEEIYLADECRNHVNSKIGSFEKMIKISKNPTEYEKDEIIRSNNFRNFVLKIQWLTSAVTSKDAERSFFKINQQGVILSTTEKKLCKSRDKANCIATRAIMKGGVGHQYWGDFSQENQDKIKIIAKECNELLFEHGLSFNSALPCYPMGGKITSGMPMVFDCINIVNKKDSPRLKLEDDKDGDETLLFLRQTRKSIWQINSKAPSSLGLHSLVYFYNSTGSHQQSTYLAISKLIQTLDSSNELNEFTSIRKEFEDFLVKNKVLITQIIRKYGSNTRSYKILLQFYTKIISYYLNKINSPDIITLLKKDFDFLNPDETEIEKNRSKNFTTEIKNARRISDELETAKRCTLCGSRMPMLRSLDHIIDKKDGGYGTYENSQTTHFYCNTTYKDYLKNKTKLVANH